MVQGTNLLIIASEDFSEVIVKRVGPLDPEYGFIYTCYRYIIMYVVYDYVCGIIFVFCKDGSALIK